MITVRRRLLFNTDRFESAETEVVIADIPDDTQANDVSRKLDELMAPELDRIELATSRAEGDTSLYTWQQIAKEGADA